MKVLALLAICLLSVSAHVCLFQPPMRFIPIGTDTGPNAATNEGPLTIDEYNNAGDNNVPFQKCRRNIQISPFGNNGTTNGFGSVCGGSSTHPDNFNNIWNLAGTPSATYSAGSTVTIQFLENAAHPDPSGGRSTFHRIDYSPITAPQSQDDFIEIAIIPASAVANSQHTFMWQVPDESFTGVFRVIYHTADPNAGVNPLTSGVSNTYTSCADIQVTGNAVTLVASTLAIFIALFVTLF